jgi:hypothetical protein
MNHQLISHQFIELLVQLKEQLLLLLLKLINHHLKSRQYIELLLVQLKEQLLLLLLKLMNHQLISHQVIEQLVQLKEQLLLLKLMNHQLLISHQLRGRQFME